MTVISPQGVVGGLRLVSVATARALRVGASQLISRLLNLSQDVLFDFIAMTDLVSETARFILDLSEPVHPGLIVSGWLRANTELTGEFLG